MLRTAQILSLAAFLFEGAACATTDTVSYRMLRDETQRRQQSVHETSAALTSAQLDRQELIKAVLARNPSLDSALHAWRAALARCRQAGAYEDPMLSVSFAPLSIASSHARFGYSVELSQRVPLGGKLGAQATIAAAEAQSASSDYADMRLKLALAASELFDDYALAVRSREVQTQHIALLHTLQKDINAAYETGSASTQDALQAEAELARLEYQLTVFDTQRDVAIAQLNALLHRDATATLPEPAAAVDMRVETESSDTHIEQRPDIAAAVARVRVASARADAAEREAYPDLNLSTSYNSMWDMPEHRWMAAVGINIPLQRERRRGGIDEAAAMRAAAESDVQNLTDVARSEIAIATRELQQAERAVGLYEQRLLPIARARIDAAHAGFIASRSSFMTVIDAERSLRSTELDLEMARAELGKRRAALGRALGRIPGVISEKVKQ